jgi:hypothetical protein
LQQIFSGICSFYYGAEIFWKVIFDGIFIVCFQSSCSSASPSYIFEDYLSSEVDHVLDKVVEDLIDEAAAIIASEII